MTRTIKAELVTTELLEALGEDAFAEVVDGRLVELGTEGAAHGAVTANVMGLLGQYVMAAGIGTAFAGQTDYVLKGTPEAIHTLRVSDGSVVSNDKLPGEVPAGFFYQPPDIAVEVISSRDKTAYVQAKLTDYFEAGTREVWVVYPDLEQIVVHRKGGATTLAKGDTLTSETLLPGFTLNLADVFD